VQVALDDRIMEASVMQMTTIIFNYLNRTVETNMLGEISFGYGNFQTSRTDAVFPIIAFFFPLALQPQFGPWPTSMKLSV
jgi:hypothetical protein